MNMTSTLCSATLLGLVAITTSACDQTVEDQQIRRIATLDLGDEGIVDFYALPDGSIDIAHQAPIGAPAYVAHLTVQEGATPLEIYQALAPAGATPPVELVESHEATVDIRQARDERPRDLRVAASEAAGGCTSDSGWFTTWENLINPVAPLYDENNKYTTSSARNTSMMNEGYNRVFGLCHLSESGGNGEQPLTIVTDLGGGWWFWYPTYDVDEGYYLTYTGSSASRQYASALADEASSTFWLAAARW